MTLGAPRTGRTAFALLLGDALAIYGAFWLAFLIRFRGQIPAFNWSPFQDAAPWLVLAGLVILYVLGLYHEGPVPVREEMVGAWVASGVYLLLGMGISYAGGTYAIPRTVFIIQAPIQAVLVLLVHGAVNQAILRWAGPLPLLVLGPPGRAHRLAEKLLTAGGRRWNVTTLEAHPASLKTVLEEHLSASQVWLYLDDTLPDPLRRELALAGLQRRATLLVSPAEADLLIFGSADFTYVGDMLLAVVRPLRSRADLRVLKRIVDLVGAILLGALSAPFWLLASVLIGLTSRGPVFYRQERLGRDGKRFTLLKFRTMVDGAENDTGAVMATSDDHRITPVGRLLRATRIDELPQILNVLRGDMSLVGPRPERPEFARQYERELPLYSFRHTVKPGITGLAQVIGTYHTPVEEKLRFDLLYVRTHSLLMDLQILLWTVKVVLLPERARGVPAQQRHGSPLTGSASEQMAATALGGGEGCEGDRTH